MAHMPLPLPIPIHAGLVPKGSIPAARRVGAGEGERHGREARKREEMLPFLHIPRQDRAVLVENKKEGRQNPCMAREEERRHRQEEHRDRKEERMERQEQGRERQEALGRGGSGRGREEIVGKTYQFCLKNEFLAMFLAEIEHEKLRFSVRNGSLEEGGVEESQEKAKNGFSFRILVGKS